MSEGAIANFQKQKRPERAFMTARGLEKQDDQGQISCPARCWCLGNFRMRYWDMMVVANARLTYNNLYARASLLLRQTQLHCVSRNNELADSSSCGAGSKNSQIPEMSVCGTVSLNILGEDLMSKRICVPIYE
jgi:hypothetical protein